MDCPSDTASRGRPRLNRAGRCAHLTNGGEQSAGFVLMLEEFAFGDRIVHDTGRGLHEYDGADRHWRQAAGELAAYLEKRPGKPVPRAIAGLLFVGGAPGRGLLVRDAVVDGPAFVAGIRGGDRILSVNGHELGALDQFHDWIDYCEPGDVGEFVLQNRRVEVTLASPRR